jgi:hypothetical protein
MAITNWIESKYRQLRDSLQYKRVYVPGVNSPGSVLIMRRLDKQHIETLKIIEGEYVASDGAKFPTLEFAFEASIFRYRLEQQLIDKNEALDWGITVGENKEFLEIIEGAIKLKKQGISQNHDRTNQ